MTVLNPSRMIAPAINPGDGQTVLATFRKLMSGNKMFAVWYRKKQDNQPRFFVINPKAGRGLIKANPSKLPRSIPPHLQAVCEVQPTRDACGRYSGSEIVGWKTIDPTRVTAIYQGNSRLYRHDHNGLWNN